MTLQYDPTLDQPLDPLQNDYGLSDSSTAYPDFAQSLQDAATSQFTPDQSIPTDTSTNDPSAAQAQVDSQGTPSFNSTAPTQDYSGVNSGYAFGGFGDLLSALSSFDTSGDLSSFLGSDNTQQAADASINDTGATDTSTTNDASANPVSSDLAPPDMFGGNFSNQGSASPPVDASFAPPPGILNG